MKLLNEIIEMLSSENAKLSEALLKTKVLLHKIGHKELVDWVNHELNGYPNRDEVPQYRIVRAQVLVNASNIAYQFNAHPIPLGHLDREYRESLQQFRLDQSLAVLEKLAENPKAHLTAPIPMEANALLGKGLVDGVVIQQAWCQFGAADVAQVLIQVRSRLLDFVLELSEQLTGDLNDSEAMKKTDAIDASSLFNQAIFGDNTTIMVGSGNQQTVSNINIKGSLESLAELLRKEGVPEADIEDLQIAVEEDEKLVDEKGRKFGPAVRTWLQKMLAKAVDASWQVELGVASSLLANALQHFYGWK